MGEILGCWLYARCAGGGGGELSGLYSSCRVCIAEIWLRELAAEVGTYTSIGLLLFDWVLICEGVSVSSFILFVLQFRDNWTW